MSYSALTLKRYFLFGTFLDETSLSGKYNEKSLLPLISYMILFAVISSKYGTSMIAISEFLRTYRQQSLKLNCGTALTFFFPIRTSLMNIIGHSSIGGKYSWPSLVRIL